jgi:hypothetical protein
MNVVGLIWLGSWLHFVPESNNDDWNAIVLLQTCKTSIFNCKNVTTTITKVALNYLRMLALGKMPKYILFVSTYDHTLRTYLLTNANFDGKLLIKISEGYKSELRWWWLIIANKENIKSAFTGDTIFVYIIRFVAQCKSKNAFLAAPHLQINLPYTNGWRYVCTLCMYCLAKCTYICTTQKWLG